MKIEVKAARKIIAVAFGSNVDTNNMIVVKSESGDEVKLHNDDVLFSVSAIKAKKDEEQKERWMYSVLCSDSETNMMSWKYVHPTTREVYDDPSEVSFETLPFAA